MAKPSKNHPWRKTYLTKAKIKELKRLDSQFTNKKQAAWIDKIENRISDNREIKPREVSWGSEKRDYPEWASKPE